MVGSEYAAFFDLDENGEVDVLYGVKNSSGNYEIKGLYNHQETDSFFLKTFSKLIFIQRSVKKANMEM